MKKAVNKFVKVVRTSKAYDSLKTNKVLRVIKDRYDKKQYQYAQDNVKAQGLQLLLLLKESFQEIEQDFWLDYGTLLGAIREKDFIGHDKDLDIGTFDFPDDVKKQLEGILLRKGFVKYKQYELDGKIIEESYSYNGAHVDFFYYHQKEEGKVWCYFCEMGNNLSFSNSEKYQIATGYNNHIVTSRFNGLMPYEFKGEMFTIPSNYEEYIIDNYGETYMIVNENWVNGSSPQNIDFNESGAVIAKEYL
ncbi:LicD family protein [Sporosarcina saromensis]|uniref:LicD family protein n=1 Tax=Sporosarcina saromensis TaxID=359365 RepID=A0ABU4GAQ5_9BACL|nr:LicD family protein [Sporosarcina saromensis]MDW0114033.1 LicD family protein [Sporosarcina saromensis]